MFSPDIMLSLKRLSVAFVPLMLGIIVHEVAHGWVAFKKGDNTAYMLGRLTLNPLPHIDPMGLLAFVLTGISGSFIFGWAKPVPVNMRQLRNPLRDMMLISAAGPLSNLVLAFVFGVLLKLLLLFFPLTVWQGSGVYAFFLLMFQTGIVVNCGLCWLNLLPIPPLDGSKILAGFLPTRAVIALFEFERYGFMLLIALLATGVLGKVLRPLVGGTVELVFFVVGL